MSILGTNLTLGNFEFRQSEFPPSISPGISQMIVQHQYIGGKRRLDAMGPSNSTLQWEGLFFGSDALDRVEYLRTLCSDGKPLNLQFSNFYFSVLIADFQPRYERKNKIYYAIQLLVIEDLTAPVKVLPIGNFTDEVLRDLQDALDIADAVRNPSISTAISALNALVKGIPSLAGASQTLINTVLSPLSRAQAGVGSAIQALSKTLI